MTQAKQVPSGDRFVVKVLPEALPDARSALAALGIVESLAGSDLLCLRVSSRFPDPKSAWQGILDRIRMAQWVAPLLLDDQSHPHFPTGDITVRFDHAPTEAELQRFAAKHGLRLRGRNEFVPEQVSFTPAEPRGTYLPDILQAISRGKGVAVAWANTRSRYRRGEGGR
jgi:hypothetical protein